MMSSKLSVFVDESGDLGFGDRSSPYFVVASIIVEDNNSIEYIRNKIKRLLKRINIKRRSKISEFKHVRDSTDVKERFFRSIISNESLKFKVGYIAIDKRAVRDDLKDKKHILYNFSVIHYVVSNVLRYYTPNHIIFVVDRSLNRKKRVEFNDYLNRKVDYLTDLARIEKPMVDVRHIDSINEPLLQLADYMAGMLYAKLNGRIDNNYIIRIKQRVLFIKSWPEDMRIM